MKIAVSVPDELYERADTLAAERGISRSQVYTQALREFLDHSAQDDDPVTAKINEVVDETDTGADATAVRRLVDGGHWEW